MVEKKINRVMLCGVLLLLLTGCQPTSELETTETEVIENVSESEKVNTENESNYDDTINDNDSEKDTVVESETKPEVNPSESEPTEDNPVDLEPTEEPVDTENKDTTVETESEDTENKTEPEEPKESEDKDSWTVTEYTPAKKMYAKSSANVRTGPDVSFDKLGKLSKNDEVLVTGICNEYNWYRIEFKDFEGYVSANYLVDEKIVEKEPDNKQEMICIGYDENGNPILISKEEWDYINSEEYILANGTSNARTEYKASPEYIVSPYRIDDANEWVKVNFWWEPVTWNSIPSYFEWEVYCDNLEFEEAIGNALEYMPNCPTFAESYELYTGEEFEFGIIDCDRYGETSLYVYKIEEYVGEIGVYETDNVEYLTLLGTYEYAAWISVTVAEKNVVYEEEIQKKFAEYFWYEPEAEVTVTYLGEYFVEGNEEVQSLYRYSIEDRTYTLRENEMYAVYYQECDDGSPWVGFCVYGTMDEIYEVYRDPRYRELYDQMIDMFSRITGKTIDEMRQDQEHYRIANISQAGTLRSMEEAPTEYLYFYCRTVK